MRVALDANVIIAAFAARGLRADIFEYCLSSQEIIFSKELLDEIDHNLCSKIKVPRHISTEIVDLLSSRSKLIEPKKLSQNICRDKGDLHILGLAVAGGVDAIITGDKDLLTLRTIYSIPILTPREFWNFVQKTNQDK